MTTTEETPVDNAVTALAALAAGMLRRGEEASWPPIARAVFESIDTAELATVTGRHQPVLVNGSVVECTCSRWPYDEQDDVTLRGFDLHQAHAVKAHLLVG